MSDAAGAEDDNPGRNRRGDQCEKDLKGQWKASSETDRGEVPTARAEGNEPGQSSDGPDIAQGPGSARSSLTGKRIKEHNEQNHEEMMKKNVDEMLNKECEKSASLTPPNKKNRKKDPIEELAEEVEADITAEYENSVNAGRAADSRTPMGALGQEGRVHVGRSEGDGAPSAERSAESKPTPSSAGTDWNVIESTHYGPAVRGRTSEVAGNRHSPMGTRRGSSVQTLPLARAQRIREGELREQATADGAEPAVNCPPVVISERYVKGVVDALNARSDREATIGRNRSATDSEMQEALRVRDEKHRNELENQKKRAAEEKDFAFKMGSQAGHQERLIMDRDELEQHQRKVQAENVAGRSGLEAQVSNLLGRQEQAHQAEQRGIRDEANDHERRVNQNA
jgi:hypothetical protein